MSRRVDFDAGARRRLGERWGAEEGKRGSQVPATNALSPRAGASLAFFLAIGLFVGILHGARGRGFLSHMPGRGAVAHGASAAGRESRRSEVDVRDSVISAGSVAVLMGASAALIAMDRAASAQCDELVAWGANDYGALENVPSVPMRAVSSNYHLSVGIDSGGIVRCWGSPSIAGQIPPLENVIRVCAGSDWAMALEADGELKAWGMNSYGQLNIPTGFYSAVEAGDVHVVALRTDGSLAAWGRNSFGETSVPKGVYTVIGAGSWHSLALRSDGVITGFGWNGTGQLLAPRITGVSRLVGGWKHSFAIGTGGVIHGWGTDIAGVLANRPTNGGFVDVDCSASRGVALGSDGLVVAWGSPNPTEWVVPSGRYNAITAGYTIEVGIRCACPGDFLADGTVNAADLGILLNFWGTDGLGFPGVDLDGDGIVGAPDLATLLSSWGACPE